MTNDVGRSEGMSSGARSAGGEPISPLLHHAPDVLSLQHGPSWMILALAAGAVNAGAFVACTRFVSHVTGVVSRIGLDGGAWAAVLEYTLVLGCFIGGAMTSVLAIQARALRGSARFMLSRSSRSRPSSPGLGPPGTSAPLEPWAGRWKT